MTCKDCIHSEVCYYDGEDIDSPGICGFFTDRSRFVELPCNMGDTVYFIKGGRVMSDTVLRFVIDKYAVKLVKSNGADIGYTSQFGERIFLTREEAEQALKEREHNA